MSRFNKTFAILERLETIGTTEASARQLAKLGEECIVLQKPFTEQIIPRLAVSTQYLGYANEVHSLTARYLALREFKSIAKKGSCSENKQWPHLICYSSYI